jgi:hypothetical protein
MLESSLVGGDVSVQTNNLIYRQLAKLTTIASSLTDTLNFLMAIGMRNSSFR